jgi:hypothetical protein
MRGDMQGFSRDQVRLAERMAWADTNGDRFYFDGAYFWRQTDHRLRPLKADATPADGWRHRDGCSCPLCREPSGVTPDEGLPDPI